MCCVLRAFRYTIRGDRAHNSSDTSRCSFYWQWKCCFRAYNILNKRNRWNEKAALSHRATSGGKHLHLHYLFNEGRNAQDKSTAHGTIFFVTKRKMPYKWARNIDPTNRTGILHSFEKFRHFSWDISIFNTIFPKTKVCFDFFKSVHLNLR